MKYELPPVDIEMAMLLTPNTFAVVYNNDTKEYDIIIIKDGKQTDRRAATSFGFEVKADWSSNAMDFTVLANGVELFKSGNMAGLAYDGDIITDNHHRTVEEGIRMFEEAAETTIRTDGKITFVLE